MSALTKVFVVLLVILSIIETAGMVVWVNRQPAFAKETTRLHQQLLEANAKAGQATIDRDSAVAQGNAMQAQMQNLLNLSRQENDQLRGTVNTRDTDMVRLQGSLDQATSAQKSATDALAVAQSTLGSQSTQIADLRKNMLDLQNRNAELSLANNDMTNKYDITNHQWRDAQEQIAQLQNDNKTLRGTIQKAGISEANPPLINAEPLVRVSGVVQSKQDINGVQMATISVGSADQVTRGMQFRILDPNSRDPFLGYLVVDRVEPNQAIGHLFGPRVNQVHPGVEVRTQL